MRVDQIMTRNVRTCAPGDSLRTAARCMWEADCGCVPIVEKDEAGSARVVVTEALNILRAHQLHRLPVVDNGDHLVGVLSLADAAREAVREHGRKGRTVTDTRIGEVIEAISAPRGPRGVPIAMA